MTSSTKERADVILGLGKLRAARGDDVVLTSLGLGSCVALCAYDPVTKVGGMAHMVLPERNSSAREPSPKFVDCAIPMLLAEMSELGAQKGRLVVKLAGGAQMTAVADGNPLMNIGARNLEAARATLAAMGLRVQAEETGGEHGRTVRLYLGTGKLMVSTAGGESFEV